ncbi:MAG: hypothetical protein COW84_06870 [Gammaproteobacteria bacterium CG22_combo_CG10-13_8_21_14_all_40_8]|nr:MAG: hypothetical protein COW84_06870 [Gammaproteobacteria bacterium CG22_combo_CG10-13_8_21_14_all_40_8]
MPLHPIQINKNDVDIKQLNEVRRRFMGINQQRLTRLKEQSGEMLQLVLDVLPLLLHVNHPLLPGYQNQSTPCSISDYFPGKPELNAAKKIAKSFTLHKRAQLRREILSVFLMGSMGTLGQSNRSDMDVWVVHTDDMAPEPIHQLQLKLTAIESWSDRMGVSLHLFMMTPQFFKEKHTSLMDQENCGSSQHFLLLDEFYRTALLLAGRFPLWWLVPPEHEFEYELFSKFLMEQRFIKEDDCIDFGGIKKIPAEEYFGAALWQMNKAIIYPYKSTLKIMLMEAYAANYPDVEPLSLTLKRKIYQGEIEPQIIDAYVLMYRKVEEYLLDQQDFERLEWVRKCLYLKTNIRLSITLRSTKNQWHRELLSQLVKQWGWEQDQLIQLDSRSKWKIFRTLQEKNILVKEMTQSYHFLSNFARQYSTEMKVSSHDMTVLGRKLYAIFERRSEKIERVNPGISTDLSENELSFYYSADKSFRNNWSVYKDRLVTNEISYNKPLLKNRSLLEILAWTFVNGIIKPRTKITILGEDSPIRPDELRSIIKKISLYLPKVKNIADDFCYQTLARPIKSFYLLNLNSDQNLKPNNYRTVSNINDPLSYSSRHINLIQSLDILSINSWNEITVRSFTGASSVLRLLQHAYTQKKSNKGWEFILSCDVGTFSNGINQRLNEMLHHLMNFSVLPTPSKYLWSQGEYIQYLGFTATNVEPGIIESEKELLNIISTADPSGDFIHIGFDHNCLPKEPFRVISKESQKGVVNLYYHVDKTSLKIWLSDEMGALIKWTQDFEHLHNILDTYHNFLQEVLTRQSVLGTKIKISQIQFFELKYSEEQWKLSKKSLPPCVVAKRFLPIQAVVETDENNHSMVNIYCQKEVFFQSELKENFYPVIAKFIVEQRLHHKKYPIYLTDLELTRLTHRGQISTCTYLKYKIDIENKLNDALMQTH